MLNGSGAKMDASESSSSVSDDHLADPSYSELQAPVAYPAQGSKPVRSLATTEGANEPQPPMKWEPDINNSQNEGPPSVPSPDLPELATIRTEEGVPGTSIPLTDSIEGNGEAGNNVTERSGADAARAPGRWRFRGGTITVVSFVAVLVAIPKDLVDFVALAVGVYNWLTSESRAERTILDVLKYQSVSIEDHKWVSLHAGRDAADLLVRYKVRGGSTSFSDVYWHDKDQPYLLLHLSGQPLAELVQEDGSVYLVFLAEQGSGGFLTPPLVYRIAVSNVPKAYPVIFWRSFGEDDRGWFEVQRGRLVMKRSHEEIATPVLLSGATAKFGDPAEVPGQNWVIGVPTVVVTPTGVRAESLEGPRAFDENGNLNISVGQEFIVRVLGPGARTGAIEGGAVELTATPSAGIYVARGIDSGKATIRFSFGERLGLDEVGLPVDREYRQEFEVFVTRPAIQSHEQVPVQDCDAKIEQEYRKANKDLPVLLIPCRRADAGSAN